MKKNSESKVEAAIVKASKAKKRVLAKSASAQTEQSPFALSTVSEAESSASSEWIELFTSGISVTSSVGRPVLILKDKHGVEILPVWMSPLDAGLSLTELSPNSSGSTPHSVVRRMMQALDLQAESCSFVELIGHHQYVVVQFKGDPRLSALRLRAEEAMSFCIQARVKFFSTKAFMARCRDVDAEMERLESGLGGVTVQGLHTEGEISSKKHPYMM